MRERHDEISVINNLTLTSPPPSLCVLPLPTLPLDLVKEILCRLPAKLLCQLRCICKSWNSLITDPKFAKKHLSHSTTRRIHFLSRTRHIYSSVSQTPSYLLTSYPLDSLFTNEVTSDVTQLVCPEPDGNYSPQDYSRRRSCFCNYSPQDLYYSIRGSCNGILCIFHYRNGNILLCNPSLHKFKKLPSFQMPRQIPPQGGILKSHIVTFGFGYDHVNDNYKVVIVLNYTMRTFKYKDEVKVYSLGTDCWKNIGEFPFDGFRFQSSGNFVSGTIYWLARKNSNNTSIIVSFDLENESFQEVPKPDYGNVDENESVVELSVLRDCLCMLCEYDVWQYQNKESWTKLFTVSYMRDPSESYKLFKAIYIFEDGQVLLESCVDWDIKLIVYDPKINIFKFTKFPNKSVYNSRYHGPEVFVESLILPWS